VVSQLSELGTMIVAQIESRHEPLNTLRDFNTMIKQHAKEMWEEFAINPQKKLEFYKKTLKTVVDKLIGEKLIVDHAVTNSFIIMVLIVSFADPCVFQEHIS
jgi:hypothetical protein